MKTSRIHGFGAILSAIVALCFLGSTQATMINLSPLAQLQPKPRDYNIKLGELRLSLSSKLSVAYNDNIDRASSKDETNEGWLITPQLGLGVYWPLSPMVTIDTNISVAYDDYINNKGRDQWQIGGANGGLSGGIRAMMLLSDVDTLRLQDTFERSSQNLNLAAQNYPSNYAMFTNTISALYSHQFSELMVWMTQIDHTTARTNSSEYDDQNHYTASIDSVLLWQTNERLRLGPYVRYEIYRYTEENAPHHVNGHNDSNSLQGGIAFTYDTHGALKFDGSVGLEHLSFDTGHHPSADTGDTGATASLRATLATSQLTTHSLYGTLMRYQGTLASRVNYAKDLIVGYGITLHPIQDWTVRGNIDWLSIKESDSAGEHADLLRFTLNVAYDITPQTNVGLTLRRTGKRSTDDAREYRQDYVLFSVSHKF